MLITKEDFATARRALLAQPPRDRRPADAIDFKVRPISEDWRLVHRMPAYKTAVANVAYIWRRTDVTDRFGPMPAKFAERAYELRGSGLLLPANAPLWATEDYRIWHEADSAACARGNTTEISAWHVMCEIPDAIPANWWTWLAIGFLQAQLVDRGAAVAWAIHALQGADGNWVVAPHLHAIVATRHWKTGPRHGRRHPNWIATSEQQRRLGMAWRRRCAVTQLTKKAGFGWSTLPIFR